LKESGDAETVIAVGLYVVLTATLTLLISQMVEEHLGHFPEGQGNKRRGQSQNWRTQYDDILSERRLRRFKHWDTNRSPAHTSTGVALEDSGI